MTISDTEMLVLDPKSLLTKYNIDLGDIQRISVSPLKDGVIVFHIRTVDVHLSVLFFGTNQYLSRRAEGGWGILRITLFLGERREISCR